jgi:hypothetical protein
LWEFFKAGDKRGTITLVAFVMDDTQEGQFGSEPIENDACLILAPVVHDQDFEVVRHLADFVRHSAHDPLDSVLIVVRRKEGR